MAETVFDGSRKCPRQEPPETDQTYCANHPGCCIKKRCPDGTVILVNPNNYEILPPADTVLDVIPPLQVLAPGVVAEIDQATLDGYRGEYDALAGQFAGDELIDKQAAFFAERGMLLHQQAVLGAKGDTASTLKRADLLHQAGFDSAAIRVANTVITAIDDQDATKRADLANALEIGGHALRALGRRAQASKVFLRVAEARIGM